MMCGVIQIKAVHIRSLNPVPDPEYRLVIFFPLTWTLVPDLFDILE